VPEWEPCQKVRRQIDADNKRKRLSGSRRVCKVRRRNRFTWRLLAGGGKRLKIWSGTARWSAASGFTLLFESHSTAPAGGIGTSPSYQGRQSLRSKLVPALLNKFGHGSTLASRRSRAMWRALVSCFAIFLGQSCFRSTPPSAGAPSPSHVGLGGQGTAWGISTRRRGGAVR
jgi:hypothetical protein